MTKGASSWARSNPASFFSLNAPEPPARELHPIESPKRILRGHQSKELKREPEPASRI
jgi:hypothetical protein